MTDRLFPIAAIAIAIVCAAIEASASPGLTLHMGDLIVR